LDWKASAGSWEAHQKLFGPTDDVSNLAFALMENSWSQVVTIRTSDSGISKIRRRKSHRQKPAIIPRLVSPVLVRPWAVRRQGQVVGSKATINQWLNWRELRAWRLAPEIKLAMGLEDEIVRFFDETGNNFCRGGFGRV
jgi:hypothetical protein